MNTSTVVKWILKIKNMKNWVSWLYYWKYLFTLEGKMNQKCSVINAVKYSETVHTSKLQMQEDIKSLLITKQDKDG